MQNCFFSDHDVISPATHVAFSRHWFPPSSYASSDFFKVQHFSGFFLEVPTRTMQGALGLKPSSPNVYCMQSLFPRLWELVESENLEEASHMVSDEAGTMITIRKNQLIAIPPFTLYDCVKECISGSLFWREK